LSPACTAAPRLPLRSVSDQTRAALQYVAKCQKQTSANYSISSSAVAISEVDTLRPRALAAFWLNTSRPRRDYPYVPLATEIACHMLRWAKSGYSRKAKLIPSRQVAYPAFAGQVYAGRRLLFCYGIGVAFRLIDDPCSEDGTDFASHAAGVSPDIPGCDCRGVVVAGYTDQFGARTD
jgi:hypothetical protein